MIRPEKGLFAVAMLPATGNVDAVAGESGPGLYVSGSTAFGARVTPPAGLYFTQALMHEGHAAASLEGGSLDLNAQKMTAPWSGAVLQHTYRRPTVPLCRTALLGIRRREPF
ncbi:hypothetical protein [Mesorhizobium vachelliae]|uniref:hypothetical protein n=1 Tax=Mesorhizobium vachelliae TaxID=3072309 RepID=UPI002A23B4E3|nr:hypothetical protein [Mesorhizobium sp. VK25A]